MTDEQIIDAIIAKETSRYTNRAHDRGGPTKFGITQATLSRYRGEPVTALDVETLTEAEAREIYRFLFIEQPGFDHIANDDLRSLVVDCGVNHNMRDAVVMLQRAVGATPDGVFGPKTIAAVNAGEPLRHYLNLCAERTCFYGKIVTHDPTQLENLNGWLNRAMGFVREAPL